MVGLNLTADYLGLVSATQFYLYHNLQNGIKIKKNKKCESSLFLMFSYILAFSTAFANICSV